MLVVAGLQMSTTDIEFFLKSTVGSLRYSTHSTELVGTEFFFPIDSQSSKCKDKLQASPASLTIVENA